MSTPRELFERMRRTMVADEPAFDGEILAPDVLFEFPFAGPGAPRQIRGRQPFLAFAEAGRAALPVRFHGCEVHAVHDTADPDVIVVEYSLSGTLTATGVSAAAPFIGVLRARDGRIAGWREYQNPLAMAQVKPAR